MDLDPLFHKQPSRLVYIPAGDKAEVRDYERPAKPKLACQFAEPFKRTLAKDYSCAILKIE
jgi:hypothetical protein